MFPQPPFGGRGNKENNDDTKNYYDVCIATNNILKDHKNYQYFDDSEDDKDGSKGKLISLRNYVIAGEESLP